MVRHRSHRSASRIDAVPARSLASSSGQASSAPESALPTVDVAIPTLNEQDNIGRCLDQVLSQDYPAKRIRVVVVDNGSTDGTVRIAQQRAATDGRLVVVADGRGRNVPEALNLALQRSVGDLFARVDAHGFPERAFLRSAAAAFAAGGADVGCVGGPAIQEGSTPFGRAAALARSSRFGVGGSHYAASKSRSDVDHVGWGVYRRGPLLTAGGFDPDMVAGEDEELNWRLRRDGYRIVLDTAIRFHYFGRGSFQTSFCQYHDYGRARVRVVRKHPDFLRPYHCAPAALVAVLAGLALFSPASARARRAVVASAAGYLAACIAAGVHAAQTPSQVPLVAGAFISLHFGYGTGTLRELLRPRRSPGAASRAEKALHAGT